MDLAVVLAVLAVLFVVIGLGEPLAARIRLPYTVLLAIVGILGGAGAAFFLQTDLTDALDPVARSILEFPVSSQVFLFVFLPTLLFQVSLTLNLRRMLDDWVPILVMAVLAVIVATFAIGFALQPFTTQSLAVCLLLGAIVATTDPSAVVGIFREIGAPGRLTRLIEGESLLNDAAAIALFGLFFTLSFPWSSEPNATALWTGFLLKLGGGALAGYGIARTMVWVMEPLRAHRLGQVSVSLALPYITYIAAERLFDVSGVVAVVAAGMTLNLLGPARLPPLNWSYLRETWELLAHWAGSLIFIFAALLVPQFLGDVTLADLGLLAVVVVAATAARALTLFGLLPLLRLARLSPPISLRYKTVILWGGLRGAVTLALALAVSEDPVMAEDSQRFVAVMATGFTLFTLLVQGPTLRLLIARLKIDALPPLETALQRQVVAVALQTVREEVAETARRHEMTHDIVRSEAKRFAERLDQAVAEAESAQEILDRDRLTLGLVTLAGREREMILEGFRERVISSELVEGLLSDAGRLIEATRTGGRSAYRGTARRNIAPGPGQRLAYLLHRHLRISGLLAALVRRRFEVLLISRMILRDLHDFVGSKILRIHGRRVTDLLHDVLRRREEELDREIEGMRLQYPGFAERLERGYLRKLALRLEEREISTSFEDGLIGPDLHQSLLTEMRARRRSAALSPRLDLSRQKLDFVGAMPLFRHLPADRQRRLARALVTIFAQPGDILIRRGRPTEAVYFIASGAVERDIAVHRQRLGSGEMFGELALLSGQRRRSGQVRAITHCTVLRLDEARFLRMLARSAEMRASLIEAGIARGLTPEAAERQVIDAVARAGLSLKGPRWSFRRKRPATVQSAPETGVPAPGAEAVPADETAPADPAPGDAASAGADALPSPGPSAGRIEPPPPGTPAAGPATGDAAGDGGGDLDTRRPDGVDAPPEAMPDDADARPDRAAQPAKGGNADGAAPNGAALSGRETAEGAADPVRVVAPPVGEGEADPSSPHPAADPDDGRAETAEPHHEARPAGEDDSGPSPRSRSADRTRAEPAGRN